MGSHYRIWMVLAVSLLAAETTFSQEQPAFSELIPYPVAASLAGEQEPLPLEMLVNAALVFSGTPEASIGRESGALFGNIQAFRKTAAGVLDQALLGEMALTFLHEKMLKRYSALQTRVDAALDTGSFNCVSSAVLYMILARSVNLDVAGVKTSDHAFCTVQVNGSPIDVETTNPYGFNPGTKKDFRDSFGKVTGFSYVPPSSYRDRKTIGEKELLALILYDRISLEARRGNTQGAVPLALSAYVLVGTDEFRGLLISSVSDYGATLGARGDYSRALAFIGEAERLFGKDAVLERRRSELFHNNVISLMQTGKWEDARKLLGEGPGDTPLDKSDWTDLSVNITEKAAETAFRTDGYPAAERVITEGIDRLGQDPGLAGKKAELEHYRADLFHNQVVGLIQAGKPEEARNILGQSSGQTPLDVKDWTDLSVVAIEKSAEKALGTDGYAAASRVVADGIQQVGENQSLLRFYETLIHNQFAAFYNARRFKEAKDIITAGLSLYPGSAAFKQDLSLAETALRKTQ